jgi:hypothetical protein
MRRRRYQRATRGEAFLLMPEWILNSDRWLDLSVDARVVFVDIAMRWNGPTIPKYRINNNGRIGYGCRAAPRRESGIGKNPAARALSELIGSRERGSAGVRFEDCQSAS